MESAAVAEQLTQDINKIKLQTEELQKLDEARACAWDVDRAAAEQLADGGNEPPDSREQLEERLTATSRPRSSHGAAGLNARIHGPCENDRLAAVNGEPEGMARLSVLGEKAEEVEA